MNYTVIGNDGRTYGPAGGEQIRQWIAQARVESRTPVFTEGAADWTFLGLLPEFAQYFPETPQIIAPLKSGAAPVRVTNSFAIASLVCGILAWMSCICCCAPFNLLGLIFAIIALVQISGSPQTQAGHGFAIAGLILSATSLLWAFGLALISLATNHAHTQTVFSFGPN
jgi:Domain of unknown function (DUF4190)/GYF domain 2